MIGALANLIGIGRTTRIDDSGELQLHQVTEGAVGNGFADRVTDDVRRVSEFGFASVPPIGAEVLVLRRLSQRVLSLVIGTSHRPSRPRGLQPGDAGLYDVRGAKVMLTANGLAIDCARLPVVLTNTTDVTVTASGKVRIEASTLEVTGDVISRADGAHVSLNALRDAYAAHKHGLVKAGTDTSGPTDHTA